MPRVSNRIRARAKSCTYATKPKEVQCTFCLRTTSKNFVNIGNERELLTALTLINVEYTPINGFTDYICYQCTYRLNSIKDFRQICDNNIKTHRKNYYYNLGDYGMVFKFLGPFTPKDVKDIKISSVRSVASYFAAKAVRDGKIVEQPPTQSRLSSNNSNDTVKDGSTNSDRQLLDVLYEKSEPLLATESGGTINDYAGNLQCPFCSKIYKRLNIFSRHVRQHQRETTAKTRSRSLRSSRKSASRVYNCSECGQEFGNPQRLRSHRKVHKSLRYCVVCMKEFFNPSDHLIHEAECRGRNEALQEMADNNTTNKSRTTRRYGTRSQARTQDKSELADDDDDELSEVESVSSTHLKMVDEWVKRVNDTTYEKDDVISIKSHSSACNSRASSRASQVVNFENADEEYDDNDEEEELKFEDDRPPTSIRQPYFKMAPIRYVPNNKNMPHTRKTIIPDKNSRKMVKCPFKDCAYVSRNVDLISHHDLIAHRHNYALFSCKKCNGRFIRKCYVDRHMEYQSNGRFVCYMCEGEFSFESELRQHFKQHTTNEIKFRCVTCDLEYLEINDLTDHFANQRHKDRKANKRLFEEKITNATIPEPPAKRKIYEECIRPMKVLQPKRMRPPRTLSRWSRGRIDCPINHGVINCIYSSAGIIAPETNNNLTRRCRFTPEIESRHDRDN